jgi:hypothetical protein
MMCVVMVINNHPRISDRGQKINRHTPHDGLEDAPFG